MGVKWLLRWRGYRQSGVGEDAGGLANDDSVLAGIIDALGCKTPKEPRMTKMEVKCHLLKQLLNPAQAAAAQQQQQGMRDMWLVQSSEATDTCYLVDNRSQHAVLEADNGMLGIVEKKLDYRIKSIVAFQGKRYVKGDFAVRVAHAQEQVTGGTGKHELLGHVMEIEYMPVSCPSVAAGMLGAFTELVRAQIPRTGTGQPVGSLDRVKDVTEKYQHLPPNFSHQHAAVLYVDMSQTLKREQLQRAQLQGPQQAAQRAQQAGTPQQAHTPQAVAPVR